MIALSSSSSIVDIVAVDDAAAMLGDVVAVLAMLKKWLGLSGRAQEADWGRGIPNLVGT